MATRYRRKPKPLVKPTILVDDREKKGWIFLNNYYDVKVKRLPVADYTFKGYEDRLAIEKKSGWSEILTNLAAPSRKRFERYLTKLSKYEHKVIVICEPYTAVKIRTAVYIMKKKGAKCQLTEKTVHYWMAKITGYYGIPVICCGKPLVETTVLHLLDQYKEKLGG